MKPTIMIVEDEFVIALDLQQKLTTLGYQAPMIAANGEDAIRMVKDFKPDLILMDIVLNGPLDGIDTALKIKEFSDIPVVYTTSYSDKQTLDRAKATNAYAYVTKPYESKDLVIAIEISISRFHSQKLVLESEIRFRKIVESTKDAYFLFDLHGKIIDTNQFAILLTGFSREELLASNITHVFKFLDEATLNNNLHDITAHKQPQIFEGELVCKNETKICTEIRFSLFEEKSSIPTFLALGRDISERKTAEVEKQNLFLELAHTSKLATLGTMSASIIHELKNPLTSILGFTELLLFKEKVPEKVADKVNIIRNAAKHMQNYVEHLKTFVRKDQAMDMEDIDINQAIDDAILLISGHLDGISVKVHKGEGLPKILGNRTQIESIIQNFLINSRDAFKNIDSPRVKTIDIFSHTHDNQVLLTYEDNAGGIPKEIMHKIFEPFFTTKSAGEGTGLGLSIVKYIMEQHRGYIEVTLRMNIGTRFTLQFPRVENYKALAYDNQNIVRKSIEVHDKPHLLLVDDDPNVTDLFTKILNKDFEVKSYNDSEEAIDHLKNSRVDVIVTDLSMPKFSGEDIISLVEKNFANTPIVLITGREINKNSSPYDKVKGVIEKPILSYDKVVAHIKGAMKA